MKLQTTTLGLIALLVAHAGQALGQTTAECTRELARTDDCAAVINPNACYNQFRFRNAQTLSCIEGTDDNDRKRKACACCTCVGAQMCDWLRTNRYCDASGTTAPVGKGKKGKRRGRKV